MYMVSVCCSPREWPWFTLGMEYFFCLTKWWSPFGRRSVCHCLVFTKFWRKWARKKWQARKDIWGTHTAHGCPMCLLYERRNRGGQYGESWMQEPSLPPSSMCLWHESGAFLLSPPLTSMGKIMSVSHARWLTCTCCTLPPGGREASRSRGCGALAEVIRVWRAEEWMPPTQIQTWNTITGWWEASFKVRENIFCFPVGSTCYFSSYLTCLSTEFNLICFVLLALSLLDQWMLLGRKCSFLILCVLSLQFLTTSTSVVEKSWLRLCKLGFLFGWLVYFSSSLLPLPYIAPLANTFIRLSNVHCDRPS